MWKLKENAIGKTKTENALTIKTNLEALNGKIPVIKYLEVAIKFLESGSNKDVDVILYSEFENTIDLNEYQNHPLHLDIVTLIRSLVVTTKKIDYNTN